MTVTRLKPDFRISDPPKTVVGDPYEARLAALETRIASIEARLTPQRRITPEDRRTLETILPIIHRAARGSMFTLRELREHAIASDDAALLAVVSNRMKLGKLFRRTTRIEVNGLVIERASDKEPNGVVWRIAVV